VLLVAANYNAIKLVLSKRNVIREFGKGYPDGVSFGFYDSSRYFIFTRSVNVKKTDKVATFGNTFFGITTLGIIVIGYLFNLLF